MQTGAARPGTYGEGVAHLLAVLGQTAAGHPFLTALSQLDWAAALPNRTAPGYIYLAGAVAGQAVGGGGQSLAEAAGRLAGEAAEALAQSAAPLAYSMAGDPQIDAIWCEGERLPTRISGVRLDDDAALGLPATAVHVAPDLDRERAAEAPPRSLGLAAATTPEGARLAGLLELVERDAAAGWWLEGARPRAVDPADAASAGGALAAMREGAEAPLRCTSLMALPATGDVPVACAFSRDPDGRGLAVGLKASLEMAEALRGAVMEMLQMEIALEMARHRQKRGQPTAGDRGALDRATLDLDAFAAFAALPARKFVGAGDDLKGLVAKLGRHGVRVTAADLPAAPDGFYVAKVFATGLRPFPSPWLRASEGTPGTRARLMA